MEREYKVLIISIVCGVIITAASFIPYFWPYTYSIISITSKNYYELPKSQIVTWSWRFINFTIHHWKPTYSIILNVIIGIFHVLGIALFALLWLVGCLIFVLLMAFIFLTIYLIPWCFAVVFHWAVKDVFRSDKAANVVSFIFFCLSRLGVVMFIVYVISSIVKEIEYSIEYKHRKENNTVEKYQETIQPTSVPLPSIAEIIEGRVKLPFPQPREDTTREGSTMKKYQKTIQPTSIQFPNESRDLVIQPTSAQFPDVPQELAATILSVLQNRNNSHDFIHRAIQGWVAHADSERTKKAVKDMIAEILAVSDLYDAAFKAEMSKHRYDNINTAKDVYDATLERDKKKFYRR
jgi:hypothetical protein